MKQLPGYYLINSIKKNLRFYLLAFFLTVGIPTLTVSAQESGFSIHIARPGEGETFYAGPSSLMYSIAINGWVSGYGTNPGDIQVHMELFNNEEAVGSLTKQLKPDSTFSFYATVNPDATEAQFPPEQGACAFYCHVPANLNLPNGAIKVRITAENADGERVSAERHFFVDRSIYAAIPVKVVHAEDPSKIVAGVPVQASTRLYLWRARLAVGLTDERGIATVKVEALTGAPTNYDFRIEPVVVDGVQYAGLESVEVSLPSGASEASPITLRVTSQTGRIDGRLSYEHTPVDEPIRITAIRLSDGSSYLSEVSKNNEFSFPTLPVDRYLIMADNLLLVNNGLKAINQEVDLATTPQLFIEIPVTSLAGSRVAGTVAGEEETWLPFAWVTVKDSPNIKSVLLDTGEYQHNGLPLQPITLYASSPGYYSQERVIDLTSGSDSGINFNLIRQQEAITLIWEDGEIFIPTETQAEIGENSIIMEYGWLWGHSEGEKPFIIQTSSVEIQVVSGKFALEVLPNRSEWLYVLSGQANVRLRDTPEIMTVQANQMVNLINRQTLTAIAYQPGVLSALRPMKDAPIPLTWEPTLGSQIRARLASISVGFAQIITLVIYLAIFLTIFAAPVIALYWWWKLNLSNQ